MRNFSLDEKKFHQSETIERTFTQQKKYLKKNNFKN